MWRVAAGFAIPTISAKSFGERSAFRRAHLGAVGCTEAAVEDAGVPPDTAPGVASCRPGRRDTLVSRNRTPTPSVSLLRMTTRQPPISELPPTDLKARTLDAVHARLSPTRRTQLIRGAILVAGSLVAGVVLFFWVGGIRVSRAPLGPIAGNSLRTGVL